MGASRRRRAIRAAPIVAVLMAAVPKLALGQEHADHDHEVQADPSQRHLAHAEAHGGFPAFVDIFFTHHAYLERKLHPRVDATFSDELRQYAGSGELVWQFGEWFGAEIEVSLLTTDPEGGEGATGLSDLEVAPMVALVQDPGRLLIVSVRSGFVLPTGDEDEGLGIEGWGWEPGLLVWKGFGTEKRGAIQGELGHERVFADQGEDEGEIVYNIGLSYWLPSNWIPIVELSGVTPTGSPVSHPATHEATAPREDTLIAATLGFRYAFANEQQWGAGIQFPLTATDAYDVRLVVGGIIHIP